MLSRAQLFATLWTAARRAPQSVDCPGENTGVGTVFSFKTRLVRLKMTSSRPGAAQVAQW